MSAGCYGAILVGILFEVGEVGAEGGAPVGVVLYVETEEAAGACAFDVFDAVVDEECFFGNQVALLDGFLEVFAARFADAHRVAGEKPVEIARDAATIGTDCRRIHVVHHKRIGVAGKSEPIILAQFLKGFQTLDGNGVDISEPAVGRFFFRYVVATGGECHTAAEFLAVDQSFFKIKEKILLTVYAHILVCVDAERTEAAHGFCRILNEKDAAHVEQYVLDFVISHLRVLSE